MSTEEINIDKIKKELGRDLTALEAIKTRREHPPPASIFFGGAT